MTSCRKVNEYICIADKKKLKDIRHARRNVIK